MKNILKTLVFALLVTVFASCQSGTPKGTTDSVANNPSDTGTSTTVDTMNMQTDSTAADTTK